MTANANPLKPPASLLCKIGSIAVHTDEMLNSPPSERPFDKAALVSLLNDPEVNAWLAQMSAIALLPVKRR